MIKKIFIGIGLAGFLVLSFLLQMKFYTLELGFFFGVFILILIEATKLLTELTLFNQFSFKSGFRKYSAKIAVSALAICVISMSFYATQETISRLNQDSVNQAQMDREKVIRYNQDLAFKKSLLEGQIKGYKDQLQTNNLLLKSYSDQPREFWKVSISSIQRENQTVQDKINQANIELLNLSQTKEKILPAQDTKTAEMNFIVILFLAGFLEAGVMFLCFLIGKLNSAREVRKEDPAVQVLIKDFPVLQKPVNRSNLSHTNTVDSKPESVDSSKDWKSIIRRKMDESDLNQDDWSRQHLGISKQALHKLLKGISNPSDKVRQRIEALAG